MIKFDNIIVPTDYSSLANSAVPHALELAKSFNSTVHLVHVFEAGLYFTATAADTYAVLSATPSGWLATKYIEDELRLQKLAQSLSRDSIVVSPVMRKGNAAHEIAKFADELPNAVVVIATHGRTGLQHMLMGSVAERVVRSCPCPVLTIPLHITAHAAAK